MPAEPIRRLRTVWRLRDQAVKEAGRAVQHMQRALTEMNVQLHNVISDLAGVTGQAIVRAILKGERDPVHLAGLRDRRIQAREQELVESLRGNWKEEVLFELQQAVEAYDFHRQQIAQCDVRLQEYLTALPSRQVARAEALTAAPSLVAPAASGPASPANPRATSRPLRCNRSCSAFWGWIHDHRRHRCNDGANRGGGGGRRLERVEKRTPLEFVAQPRPQARHQRRPRYIRHTREHRTNRVGNAFRMAAQSLIRSNSYLGARFRYLRAKLGGIKAVKAMARHLACLFYRLVTKGQAWVDRGAEHFKPGAANENSPCSRVKPEIPE